LRWNSESNRNKDVIHIACQKCAHISADSAASITADKQAHEVAAMITH